MAQKQGTDLQEEGLETGGPEQSPTSTPQAAACHCFVSTERGGPLWGWVTCESSVHAGAPRVSPALARGQQIT